MIEVTQLTVQATCPGHKRYSNSGLSGYGFANYQEEI